MTRHIDSLRDIAGDFDVIVLDQWGVLHDGTAPYPGAVAAVRDLSESGTRIAVLSNSGKRALPNARRIAGIGFPADLFETVMTSGEALWRDIATARIPYRRLCPIVRDSGDAEDWAAGLPVTLTDDPRESDAVLLMGLSDRGDGAAQAILDRARDLPVLCTNPDRASPRADGVIVASPGALAHDHAARGGTVHYYGKPHGPVFRAVEAALGVAPRRMLMVGDSLEHDIAGGFAAGWSTAFVRGGLRAGDFADGADVEATLIRLSHAEAVPLPDYSLHYLG